MMVVVLVVVLGVVFQISRGGLGTFSVGQNRRLAETSSVAY